jgi:hypothetical protein
MIFHLVKTDGGPETRNESLAIDWPADKLPLAAIPKPERRDPSSP